MRSPLLTLGLPAAVWMACHVSADAVRGWRPGAGQRLRAGPLATRVLGSGDPVVVLLHGLVASGDYFGSAFDELGQVGTLVVPDLLGFGASMRPPGGEPGDYGAEAHLAALDAMLAALDLRDRPLVIVGHSMGAVLGLRWAARHPAARAVVTFAAPLYSDPRRARAHLRRLGAMAAVVTSDGALPPLLCGWMCRYRRTASWIAAALHPELPVPLARAAVHHTWASYRGSLTDLVLGTGWRETVNRLTATGVPLLLAHGEDDPVPEPGSASTVAQAAPSVSVVTHPTGGHDLPLVHPHWCLAQVRTTLAATSPV